MIKEALIKQFTTCYDENGWFVAVRNAIEGVTAEQADWKPAGSDHSIRSFLSHLSYYNYAYLRRFKGENYQYPKADNDETFAADKDWDQEVAEFDAVMTEWRELLNAADESKFDEPVPTKDDGTKWSELIADINAHNAYHAGEIVLVRRLQGSWKPNKGVS
ncbi:MAG TPA: DinB family protein [Pyrinomonadaceae bacterium]|nr:DinB family protein [Pyrinomonadaceae bacterium]